MLYIDTYASTITTVPMMLHLLISGPADVCSQLLGVHFSVYNVSGVLWPGGDGEPGG